MGKRVGNEMEVFYLCIVRYVVVLSVERTLPPKASV